MKPETKALLHQCRAVLLRRSDEQLAALLEQWFANMIGDESMDEELDDLCLLLDYRVQTWGAQISYATYTSWWEVEGYLEPSEGTFTCANLATLRQRLFSMPIKQFGNVVELAYQARSAEAELDGAPHLPIGQAFLREFAVWLESTATEPESAEQSSARQTRHFTAVKPAWMLGLERLRTEQNTPAPPALAEAVVLPDEWAALLTREQLSAFLVFLELPARSREAKETLVERLLARLETDPAVRAQFFEVFVRELAVPPWELETLLGCTPTERKRWTAEGKLPVLEQRGFRKGGSQMAYPVFDRRIILGIARAELELWRAEHQARVNQHRRAGAQAAAANRKAKRQDLL